MCGYYRIPCHVNMYCSCKTYSHFCIKHLAQKALKKANYPEIPPKKKQKNPPLETSKPENMLKMTHVRIKKQKFQKKNKRAHGSGRYYSQNQELSVRNFRF